ncbi:MAG: hypothetical protein IBJ16_15065, partial [Chitinophagaceae bacterium]|nr:hypothetical protein [Chitinophagaceae bacterium]
MRPIYLFLLFFFVSIICIAQKNDLPKKLLRFNIGESTHGTGDLKGISFGTAYTHYLKKKISLEYHFKGTIHDDQDTYLLFVNGNLDQDGSVRTTTAGFQIGSLIRYSPIRTPHHEFTMAAGPYGRYESSSLGSNGYAARYPSPASPIPRILIEFDHSFPQRIYNIGYMAELSYNYTFKKQLFIGINAAFQNDTNG